MGENIAIGKGMGPVRWFVLVMLAVVGSVMLMGVATRDGVNDIVRTANHYLPR